MSDSSQTNWDAIMTWDRGWRERCANAEAERDRLRALLKQAHDRDKFQGEHPTVKWYDDVARYFEGKCP